MNPLQEAFFEVSAALDAADIPHMLVGGMAYSVWCEPRYTSDVDLFTHLEDERIPILVETLRSKSCRFIPEDPVAYAKNSHFLPLVARNGMRVDIILGSLDFEREMLGRATNADIEGHTIRICSPEDLILLKVASTRGKDYDDLRGLVVRRFLELDLAYLEPKIREVSVYLEDPEVLLRWENAKEEWRKTREG